MPMIRVNGIDVNYVDEGTGEPFVLVHNLISSIHGYDFNIPIFTKYFRTIAYDLRGHGLSSKPDSEAAYNFDIMSEDLYQLLKALDITSCYLLGTAAVGRGIIFTFFMKHPEMVKALISVSGGTVEPAEEPASEDERALFASGRRLREVARERGMMAVLEERRKNMYLWTERVLTRPDIVSRFEEMYRQTAVAVFTAFPQRFSDERRQQLSAELNRVGLSVLQLVGLEDPSPGRTIQALKNIYPQTHGLILPESGHYPAIENPDDFNQAVLNFLAGVRTYAT